MTVRRFVTLLAACALAAPAAADAAPAEPPPTGGAAAPTGDEPLQATRHVMVDSVVRFDGRFHAGDAGRAVSVERFDAPTLTWLALASAVVGPDGRWTASWRADVPGQLRTRATLVPGGTGAPDTASSSETVAEADVTVYRPAVASWYGPGFFGRSTACGPKLNRRTLGVAHRTLPCGTQVALRYGGASIIVPVIDRGPFVKGRKWDLTAATAQALDFTYTDRLGAIPLD